MNKRALIKRGRQNIIDLCCLYSKYVCGYKNSYLCATDEEGNPINLAWRLSLSALIDIEIMKADAECVASVYEKSPGLECDEFLKQKLYAFPDEYILEILEGYDRYIIDADDNCTGNCPVCLDEYLDTDYCDAFLTSICKQFDAQVEAFEAVLINEGAVAMREYNADKLYITDHFVDAFNQHCDECFEGVEDNKFIDAMASLVRDNRLIPKVLDWFGSRDVRLAVISGTFNEMFLTFREEIVSGKKVVG